jgi:hypothetical protein
VEGIVPSMIHTIPFHSYANCYLLSGSGRISSVLLLPDLSIWRLYQRSEERCRCQQPPPSECIRQGASNLPTAADRLHLSCDEAANEEQRAAQPIHGKELPRCSNYDRISGWSSKVDLTCCRGHTWSASVVNVVFGRTWCRRCLQEERSLGEQDFHRTAQQMGGTFLGFSSPILIDSDAKVTKGV